MPGPSGLVLRIASMGHTPARYEAIADWYAEFTKDWGTELNVLLPEDIGGQRVLDLAAATWGP